MGYAHSSVDLGNILGNIFSRAASFSRRHSRRYKVESGGLLIRRWRKLSPPKRGARAAII
jgi:hypothetical protein